MRAHRMHLRGLGWRKHVQLHDVTSDLRLSDLRKHAEREIKIR